MNHLQRCKEDWCQGQLLFDAMIQLCTRFLESKKNKHTDPVILALQLWSTVHGLVSLMQAKRLQIIEHIPEKKLIAQTIETTIDLLTRCK
jgi:Tetracyclin repressor-like, C-terminal domain